MPAISALRRLRQEDGKFKTNLSYIVSVFYFLEKKRILSIIEIYRTV
jgi:hypothetical protein